MDNPIKTVSAEKYAVVDKVLAQRYALDFAIPYELANILVARFASYSEAEEFLFPNIENLHDPWSIPDMVKAVDDIIVSIKGNESILVYCHDDIDGYTSGTIMYKSLIDLTRGEDERIFLYPVVREKDGYILNPDVLKRYQKQGVRLLITVDFGISSLENFRIASELGLKLVVCDHHETNLSGFPGPAVDPKRPDSQYPFRELAGVGVSFKLAQCLYQRVLSLSSREFYSLKRDFFPLLMLGTISDRVILLGENRIFSAHGLAVLNKLDEPWIKYFRKDKEVKTSMITREIIPTIGSAAYVDPKLGVEVFLNRDFERVSEIFGILENMNEERKHGVNGLLSTANSAAKLFPQLVVSIIPFSKQHYLGAVAARLKDQHKRTSIVIGLKDGKCFGELRSNTVDLFKILDHFKPLFIDFGGHCKAAGFTMSEASLDRFVDGMVGYFSSDDLPAKSEEERDLNTQAIFFLERTKINLLQPMAPFGVGNQPPLLTDGINIYTIDSAFNVIEKEISGKP